MTRTEMIQSCKEFFNTLSDVLSSTHEVIGSCNQDISQYLIPIGTIDRLTYYSKPSNSFRISDHWNWYSSFRKCKEEHYIQCYTRDLPWTKRREGYGKASKPIYGICVCVLGGDGIYHVVYGERFDRKNKKWDWVESDPADIAEMVMT